MSNSSEEDAHQRAICSRITLQSKKEGFFQQLADGLASNVDFSTFLSAKTDLERFKIVATACWDHINSELIFRGKNTEVAVEKRLEGNKYFEKNELKKALLCYCQSLIQAPVGPDLVSAYTNRSALLVKMEEYQAAIDDAELAISHGSLEETKHKLYERMTSCYISLKNYQKAKVTARLAKHLAEKHDPTNEKFFKKLEKQVAQIDMAMKGTPSKEMAKAQTPLLPEGLSMTAGTKFANASNKVDVAFSPDAGRFMVATEKIAAGEVILCEKPYASCLHLERMGSHCTHCFVRFKVPIPCETCSHVVFCSRKCRKEAETYHQYECKVMALLMGSGMSSNAMLAMRMITQTPVDKFKEIFPLLQNDPSKIHFSQSGKYDADSYLHIYNLGGLEEFRSPVDFYERTLMAVFIIKCLRLNQYFQVNLFKQPKPGELEFMIGSLLLRNLQVLQFNAYEICEFLMESRSNYRKSTSSSVGLAIYSTASYFNHACSPDVTRFFNGLAMVVQSIKGIETNKPIYDNYGPIFTKMERTVRRQRLSARYWFDCKCTACVNDWPMLISAPVELAPANGEEKKALKKLQVLDQSYFDEGMKTMERGQPLAALELFKKYISEAEGVLATVPHAKCLQSPYKTILLAQEGVKLCLCSLGSVHFAKEE